jgi:hypothetical protein
MDGSSAIRAATAALAACATLAACGNDDKPKNTRPAANTGPGHTLKRPYLATCAAPQFAKPRILNLRPNVWSLQYTRVKPPPPNATGASTTVLIVEYPPATHRVASFGPHTQHTTIAGRRLDYHDPNNKSPFYTARWQTKNAFYTLIANGTNPASLQHLIPCLA